ncbi:putative amidase [Lyophyllum shimeji]|uniref:Amidase n=1 Tax=Lyophyllum shimeji TaxID=47721 RepID=A0A9P3UKC0_LYOSH|nr:putative amidase [Lyophyllum shimeji]
MVPEFGMRGDVGNGHVSFRNHDSTASTTSGATRRQLGAMRAILVHFLQVSLACALVAASVDVVETDASGTILQVAGMPYYTPVKPLLTVHPSRHSGITPGFAPVTGIRSQYSPITKAFLEAQVKLFRELDDVWNDEFMNLLFISYDGQTTGFFDEAAEKWLESMKLSHLYISSNIRVPALNSTRVSQITTGPPAGPYFTTPSSTSSGLDIHNAYRLHKDEYEAFLFGVLPHPSGGWTPTNITLDSTGLQYIPVPSRIALMTKSLPLSGTRFALKDIFDAAGLPTGAGSLAYARVHPPASSTAPSVQRLLDLGATLVGKTRTSQFAHGAAPWEFHDIPYSWNPRADGYLTASASSSGSACAIAGYEWLEFTVGSDTRGSVRKPAAFVGAYGVRPSQGSLDLAGVVPLSEEMDTAGFFARDPRLFTEIGSRWYEASPVRIKRPTIRFPRKLLYPTEHFPVSNPDAQALYDAFAAALQTHLKITTVPLNLTHALLPHLPNASFPAFLRASNTLAEYRSWHSVGKPLVERHKALFNGTLPSFDPRPKQMFARAQTELTDADFASAVAVRRAFLDSVNRDLIKADTKSCSDSLLMYDAGTGGRPSYRIEDFNSLDGAAQALLSAPPAGEEPQFKDFFTFVGSMAGLPEVTVPLGQVPYFSQVSRRWEVLPVAVQVVAHRGCEDVLFEMVRRLAAKGVLKGVQVGREAF